MEIRRLLVTGNNWFSTEDKYSLSTIYVKQFSGTEMQDFHELGLHGSVTQTYFRTDSINNRSTNTAGSDSDVLCPPRLSNSTCASCPLTNSIQLFHNLKHTALMLTTEEELKPMIGFFISTNNLWRSNIH